MVTSKFESTASGPAVSVIIPTLNEAQTIVSCIEAARGAYGPDEVEIIVVDGGSSDGTPGLVPPDVQLIHTERGRATQINRGAAVAHGAVLLFCHADSRLPGGWRETVLAALGRPGVSGGVFRTRILPEVTWILWLRNRLPMSSRWWEMHGDQAQFMTRATFERLGGFPHLPLMEDVEMSRALHQAGRLVRLPLYVTTSSRRYAEHGALRQGIMNRWNLWRYVFLGARAQEIARTYTTRREEEDTSHQKRTGAGKTLRLIVVGCTVALMLGYLVSPAFRATLQQSWRLLVEADVEPIRRYLLSLGLWAPVLSALLMIVQAILLPLPSMALTLANGLVFGTIWGALLSWSSAMVAAIICYTIAYLFGRPIVIRLIGEPSIQLADQFFERYGNRAVLIARLIPGVSFDVISYAAGLSALKLGGFVVATGIGQLPATIAYSFLGATAASTASVGLWAVFGVVVLLVLSLVLRARLQKELRSNQQEADKEQ